MNDEIRKHLIDLLQAIEEIETFVHGMDFAAYQKSHLTQESLAYPQKRNKRYS
jgi:uncharacterized protein with HEPN domain